jgi:putative hemolysin
LHDLVENIIGQFPETGGQDELKIVLRDDGSYLVDAELDIECVKDVLKIDYLPNDENYKTMGGFILNHMNVIPKTGECFKLNHYKFEIVDMDRNRIDKILITPLKEHEN